MKEKDKKALHDQIVKEVKQDFEERRQKRRPVELAWRLNMNFLMGNQYASITPTGDIDDYGRQYYWQEREVYNHIAPIVETRLAKLTLRQIGRVDPSENKRRVRRAKREIRNCNPAKHNGRKLFFRAFAKGERMGGNLRQRILQNRVE